MNFIVITGNWKEARETIELFLGRSYTKIEAGHKHTDENFRNYQCYEVCTTKIWYSFTGDTRQGDQERPHWVDETQADTSKIGNSHLNICGREGSDSSPVLWPKYPPCPEGISSSCLAYFFLPGTPPLISACDSPPALHMPPLWHVLLILPLPIPSVVRSAYSLLVWATLITSDWATEIGWGGGGEGIYWVRKHAIKNWWQIRASKPTF